MCLAGLTSVVAEAKGRNDDALVQILRTLAVRFFACLVWCGVV